MTAPTHHFAFISLGSNQGDSRRILLEALNQLEQLSVRPLLRSSVWRTTPVGCPPGTPLFLNAAAGLTPGPAATPESLLEQLLRLERDFGRPAQHVPNEPRRLDLDLIAFGRETRGSATLVLPHPRAHRRRFVLQPLSEIAPDLVLPGQHQTIRELLAKLDSHETVERINLLADYQPKQERRADLTPGGY